MTSPSSTGLPSWLLVAMDSGVQPVEDKSRQLWPAEAMAVHQANDNGTRDHCQQQEALGTVKALADGEASLEELTALCTHSDDKATHGTAVISEDMPRNKCAVLFNGVRDDLERADTHDSLSTANLLPYLQNGDTSQKPLPLPQEPGGMDAGMGSVINAGETPQHTAGKGAAQEADATALPAGNEEDVEDTPLVSQRTNSILDIMCARSPLNTFCAGSPMRANPQHTLPFLHASISAASTGGTACSPTTSAGGGGFGLMACGLSDSSSGSREPWSVGTSTGGASVASLPAVASPSGFSTAPFFASNLAAFTADAVQPARLLYVGVFLTPESREVLLSMVPAMHPLLRADHMTLVYKPSVPQLLQFPVGAEVELRVLGSAADSRVQAVFVEAPAWLETASDCAHITISVAIGARAVDAGRLIKEAVQQAALASAADLAYAPAGLGAYQHFDEALPLVGRLGVRVDVPTATAVSMGWAPEGVGIDQLASSRSELVVYSVKELVSCGCFDINQTAQDGFYQQHGHLVANQVPFGFCPSPLALPAVPESAACLDDALSSACATPDANVQLLSYTATPANSSSPWMPLGSAQTASPSKQTFGGVGVSPTRVLMGLVDAPGATAAAVAGPVAGGELYSSPVLASSPPPSGYGVFGAAATGSNAALSVSPAAGGALAAILRAHAGSSASNTPAHDTQPTRGLAALLSGSSGGTGGSSMPASLPPSGGGGLAALLAAAGSNGGGSSTAPRSAHAGRTPAAAGLSPVTAQLPHISTARPGSAPAAAGSAAPMSPELVPWAPVAAPSAAAAAAAAPAEVVSDGDDADFHSPKSTTSTDSMEAVQFLSAVHEGDYVAVRPFVPADGGQRFVQGYVREFACDEPFQAEGVLVVLTDNTIGYVAVVIDSQGRSSSQGGSSSSAAPTDVTAAKPSSSKKQSSGSKKAQKAPKLPESKPAGISAAAAGSGGSGLLGGVLDPLRQWMVQAGAAVTPEIPAPELRRRNKQDVERDLQLWHEFEALQQQHGEELCNTILEACNQDFAEASALIKGQAGGLQAAASSSGGGAGSVAVTPSRAAAGSSRPVSGSAAAAGTAGRAGGATAAAAQAAAAADDEDFVRQLALSVGLKPDDALQLARLVPHLSADAVVRELQKQKGDVSLAADALLSGQGTALDADSGSSRGSSAAGSPTAGYTGGSSSSRVMSPEERAMKAFRAGKDPQRVVDANRLCEMSPGLTFEMAELLLEECGGNLHEAAQAVSELQVRELEARSGAAAAAAGASSSMGALAGAAANDSSSLANMEGLSEADRRAILEAMGELSTQPQQQQQQARAIPQSPKRQQLSASPLHGSPVPSSSPPRHQARPASAQAGPSTHCVAQPGGYGSFIPPPPPPPRAAVVEAFVDMEARRADKDRLDKLWADYRSALEASGVHGSVAALKLEKGDTEAYQEHIAKRNELHKKALAIHDDITRLAWRMNNSQMNQWSVDLHGLSVPEALTKFEKQFRCLEGMDHPGGIVMNVCVGKGKHSEGNVPKVKPKIEQYLLEQQKAHLESTGQPWHIKWDVDPNNTGMINILFPPSGGADAE